MITKPKPFCKYGHEIAVVGRDKYHRCIGCNVRAAENYRNLNKEKVNKASQQRAWRLVGIINSDGSPFTHIDYDREFQLQGGRCLNKGCQKHQNELKNRLNTDHDHKTGIFRGLLCHNCNITLGLTKENSVVLKGLIDYLNRG